MQPDTVDRTIRNQRYRGWPVLLIVCGWCAFWMAVAFVIEKWLIPMVFYGFPYHLLLWVGWIIPVLTTFVVMLIKIDRRPPKRLKLGEVAWVVPGPRVQPKDIRAFHFARDPDEDYVEKGVPIPWCELTIEYRKCRRQLIVSFGDAARVREWAEQKGVTVIDPEGYSRRNNH
jgi:hypothetical protein